MPVNFLVESWTYLAIDLVVVFARFAIRWASFGLRGLSPDDFLMVVAIVRFSVSLSMVSHD